jgi:hypothetical protein
MTLEEFKVLIKEQFSDVAENQALWELIESGVSETVNDSISGVIENRDKILKEKKVLAEKMKEMETALGSFEKAGIKIDEYEQMKQKLEALEQQAGDSDLNIQDIQKKAYEQGKKSMEQELTPKLKEYEETVTTLTKTQELMRQKHIEALSDVEINRAINDLHVETDFLWLRGLRSSAKVEYVEATDQVEIELPSPNDPNQMIPISDWKKLFPVSPEGKKRIKIQSGGSGAGGSAGKGSSTASVKDQLESMFKHY